MNNDFSEELIVRYLQNTATDQEKDIFLNWVNFSEENKKQYFDFKRIYDLKKEVFTEADIINSERELLMKLGLKQRKSNILNLIKPIYRYAAIGVLIIGFAALMVALFHTRKDNSNMISVFADNNTKTVILPDSSRVCLNRGSSITFPSVFTENFREVMLVGEAYFDVTHNHLKPFLVKTSSLTVRVLGTSFNVKAYSNEEKIVTTLVNGSIELSIADKVGQFEKKILLRPGQQAIFSKNSLVVNLISVDTDFYTDWRNGILHFSSESLEKIIALLEKEYGVNIEIDGEKLKESLYSGSFSKDQNIKDILDILSLSRPISYKIDKNNIVIYEKKRIIK